MEFEVASMDFESKKLHKYVRNYTKGYTDPMFTKLNLKMSREFYNKLKTEEYSDIKEQLITNITDMFEENRKLVMQHLPTVKQNWERIEDKYFDNLEEITGHNVDRNMKCTLLCVHRSGGYDFKSNHIWIYCNPKRTGASRGTHYGMAHEAFHIHFWKIWDALFKKFNWELTWKFSEVVVELALWDTKNRKLWPKEGKIIFWSEVQEMADKVRPLWENRTDFESFLKESSKRLKLSR